MRAGVAAESVIRPAVSRAPAGARDLFFRAATRLAHPRLRRRLAHGGEWTPANTEHWLRDWLSPRYAHRQGFNEVIGWFEDLGFEVIGTHSPSAYHRRFGYPLWGIGLAGRRPPEAAS